VFAAQMKHGLVYALGNPTVTVSADIVNMFLNWILVARHVSWGFNFKYFGYFHFQKAYRPGGASLAAENWITHNQQDPHFGSICPARS
jgi:hypothetical protein